MIVKKLLDIMPDVELAPRVALLLLGANLHLPGRALQLVMQAFGSGLARREIGHHELLLIECFRARPDVLVSIVRCLLRFPESRGH